MSEKESRKVWPFDIELLIGKKPAWAFKKQSYNGRRRDSTMHRSGEIHVTNEVFLTAWAYQT